MFNDQKIVISCKQPDPFIYKPKKSHDKRMLFNSELKIKINVYIFLKGRIYSYILGHFEDLDTLPGLKDNGELKTIITLTLLILSLKHDRLQRKIERVFDEERRESSK